MSRITEELLRKRSEHNEGCLTTMEEVQIPANLGLPPPAGVSQNRKSGCAVSPPQDHLPAEQHH